jgi:hypothetical protein
MRQDIKKFFVEKNYHIYAKERCLYHNLPEDEFHKIWNSLQKLTWLTEYSKEDLSYEEVNTVRDVWA